jgi:hypothetical protein
MNGRQRRRISEIEQAISAATIKREKSKKESLETLTLNARHHAKAVAAIINVGEPKIDEPLGCAWERVQKHYGIEPPVIGPWEKKPSRIWDQVRAAEYYLPPKCAAGEDEPAAFTGLFRAAPEWLLWFTRVVFLDAPLLKFQLPKPKFTPLKWGSEGYYESRLWPLLPLGRMTDGDPVSDKQARGWPLSFNSLTEANEGNVQDSPPPQKDQEDDVDSSLIVELSRAMRLLSDLELHPEKEKGL